MFRFSLFGNPEGICDKPYVEIDLNVSISICIQTHVSEDRYVIKILVTFLLCIWIIQNAILKNVPKNIK